jgi:beta-lactamase class A
MLRPKRLRRAGAYGAMVAALALSAYGAGSDAGSPAAGATLPTRTAHLLSVTVPAGPAGMQLTWFLSALPDVPLSQQAIAAHFDASFLAAISAAQINETMAGLPTTSAPQVTRLLSSVPSGLIALVRFGTESFSVTLSVDGSGLIAGLELTPSASATSWSQIDHSLAALAPDVSFLAARVTNGTCQAINQIAPSTPRPLASELKLFVLGALAHQIAAGRVSWDQQLSVEAQLKSEGNPAGSGSLQYVPVGTRVSVRETATKMISISDNTAADMLINLVGQPALESQVRQWTNDPHLDSPFLTTRQMFLLHYVDFPALAKTYLALAPQNRAAFLKSNVDPLPLSDIQGSTEPRDIDSLEWFGSPRDICRAFAGLHQLARLPKLSPIGTVLSTNTGDLGLDPSKWPTVWFKGGSEPGVLTLGYLATNSKGQTFVVSAMLSDAKAAIAPSATLAVLDEVVSAFGLIR